MLIWRNWLLRLLDLNKLNKQGPFSVKSKMFLLIINPFVLHFNYWSIGYNNIKTYYVKNTSVMDTVLKFPNARDGILFFVNTFHIWFYKNVIICQSYDEVLSFLNMNYSIFLIILGFIKFVFSSNNTKEDSCPISALSCKAMSWVFIYFFYVSTLTIYAIYLYHIDLRHKRAYTEYTRWRANAGTTQEFIVKVLEDDLTTPLHEESVIAVNIQPLTKAQDKIIVDGVVVSTTNTENSIDAYRNYQRFEPPTTSSSKRVGGNIVFAPVKSLAMAMSPVRPKGKQISSYG